MNLLLPDELFILSKYDFKEPNDIPHPPFKYPRVNFLVFDDLVGDPHALKKGHSAMNNLCINHRHLQCNYYLQHNISRQYRRFYVVDTETRPDLHLVVPHIGDRYVVEGAPSAIEQGLQTAKLVAG
jgi:hypothetical protein